MDISKITPQNDALFKMIFTDPKKRRLIEEREDAARNYASAISTAREEGREEERAKTKSFWLKLKQKIKSFFIRLMRKKENRQEEC